MKTLIFTLLSIICFSFTNIDINGFTVNLDECNRLHVTTSLHEDELAKEIRINKYNDTAIYLYRKTEHLPLNFRIYLPEGKYTVSTVILYKNGKTKKDSIEIQVEKL